MLGRMIKIRHGFLRGGMVKILVDADACPRSVLDICVDMGENHGFEVWTVASFNHAINTPNHISVGDAAQEVDFRIMNLCERGDVVVTQDWGLAAMLIGKGAKCISPSGRVFEAKKIDFLLEEREVKARVRRQGGRTKGPRKRRAADDRLFRQRLGCLLNS